jgi:hypothetical protein
MISSGGGKNTSFSLQLMIVGIATGDTKNN